MMSAADAEFPYKMVTSEDELTAIVGKPGDIARFKGIPRLDGHCRDFIQRSPLVLLATSDAKGRCDVSPRGGTPGFVRVLADGCLALGNARGNRRVDSMRNILQNPHLGMLFLIPGLGETLRVNGHAAVSRDPELLRQLVYGAGKTPDLSIIVQVEEAFLHCAKALIRSSVWKPSEWSGREGLASPAQIWKDHTELSNMSVDTIEELIRRDYVDLL